MVGYHNTVGWDRELLLQLFLYWWGLHLRFHFDIIFTCMRSKFDLLQMHCGVNLNQPLLL